VVNLKVNIHYDKEMLSVIGGAIRRIVPRAIIRSGYSERVIDHFENPRNVGSLDKNDKNVGTGLVGAPACFTGDTIIAVADGRRQATLDSLTEDMPVWSYNINEKKYEIKMARRVYSGEKHVWKVTFDGESSVTCTEDHEFLMRPNFEYKGNKHIKSHEWIAPFRRTVNKRGYWTIERMGSRQSVTVTEYLQIWKFHNPGICVEGHNKDLSKDNDCLERMTIAEHIIVHPPDTYDYDCSVYSREDIQTALANTESRIDAADSLSISHRELYDYMRTYGMVSERSRKKNTEEIREVLSVKMIGDKNPYFLKTEEEKRLFATHPGKTNGRWIQVEDEDEDLLKFGRELYDEHGKFTIALWQEHAKAKGYPQRLASRFESWQHFKILVENYNHKILDREYIGVRPTYTLQVEENNNYVVLTKFTMNTQSGIIVRNCGDVLQLQIRVDPDTMIVLESRFKTFGCGSAVASSSLVTEMVNGKHIDDCDVMTNKQISKHLNLPPVKLHCAALGEEAIHAAIRNYKGKNDF
jgi:NifU-like protein involved in Fe-S cluster formation